MQKSGQELIEDVCRSCGGKCCRHAHPPISPGRRSILLSIGCPCTSFEYVSYNRLKCRPDGMCVMSTDGRCTIHEHKPETCVAGPFTFDMKDNMIEIYAKQEHICPLAGYLRRDRDLYEKQLHTAVAHIRRLLFELPPDELRIVLAIPEPDTDLVAVLPLEADGA